MAAMSLLELVKLQVDSLVADFDNLEPADRSSALNYLDEKLHGDSISRSVKRTFDPQLSDSQDGGQHKKSRLELEESIEDLDRIVRTLDEQQQSGAEVTSGEGQYGGEEEIQSDLQASLVTCNIEQGMKNQVVQHLEEISTQQQPEKAYFPLQPPLYNGKIPTCQDCGETFPSLGSLDEHARKIHECQDNYQDSPTPKCKYCGERFPSLSCLDEHTLDEHTATPSEPESITQVKNISSRIKLELEIDTSGRFICPHDGCGKTFTTRWSISEHLGAHTGEWTCKDCDNVLACKRSFLRHMQKQHGKIGPDINTNNVNQINSDETKCKTDKQLDGGLDFTSITETELEIPGEENAFYAGNSSSNSQEIVDQSSLRLDQSTSNEVFADFLNPFLSGMDIEHSSSYSGEKDDSPNNEYDKIKVADEKLFCDICKKKFTSRQGLKKHEEGQEHIKRLNGGTVPEKIQPDGEGMFPCVLCNKKFKHRWSLKEHQKTKEHVRRINGESFDTDDEKVQPDEDGKFSCSECDKKFSVRWQLKRHMEFHTGGTNCEACQMTLSNFHSLKRHKQSQEHLRNLRGEPAESRNENSPDGDETFSCNDCDKTFDQKRSLKQHVIIHTGELRAKCDECELTLSNKQSLKRHKGLKHGKSVEQMEIEHKQSEVNEEMAINEVPADKSSEVIEANESNSGTIEVMKMEGPDIQWPSPGSEKIQSTETELVMAKEKKESSPEQCPSKLPCENILIETSSPHIPEKKEIIEEFSSPKVLANIPSGLNITQIAESKIEISEGSPNFRASLTPATLEVVERPASPQKALPMLSSGLKQIAGSELSVESSVSFVPEAEMSKLKKVPSMKHILARLPNFNVTLLPRGV